MAESPAEPYRLKAGPVGVLLLHGFTASPTELRPLAEALHQAGYTISGIRLAGHGTHLDDLRQRSWHDWLDSARQGLDELSKDVRQVYVIGLSMGGVLAAHLAARYPHQVQGLCLLAPAFRVESHFLFLAALLKHLVPSIPKGPQSLAYYQKHGLFAYDSMPVSALAELHSLIKTTTPLLPQVRQPTTIFMGMRDHTVVPSSGLSIWKTLGAQQKTLVHLPTSGHILSVEPDAPYIIEHILGFLRQHAPV
jgi:carboxylesterase